MAQRVKYTKNCTTCKKTFHPWEAKSAYCSRECSSKGKILQTKQCLNCGKVKSRNAFHSSTSKANLKRVKNSYIAHISKYCKKCKNKKLYMLTPDKILRDLTKIARARSKLKNFKFNIDSEYLKSLYELQKGKCNLSDFEMTNIRGEGHVNTNISVDRIDSKKGYIKGNIQLVCLAINKMKFDFKQKDFKNWCKLVVEKSNEC